MQIKINQPVDTTRLGDCFEFEKGVLREAVRLVCARGDFSRLRHAEGAEA